MTGTKTLFGNSCRMFSFSLYSFFINDDKSYKRHCNNCVVKYRYYDIANTEELSSQFSTVTVGSDPGRITNII